jgi:hypothetical protein
VFAPADYYYTIPVRKIYKSYPIYVAGKEPKGYLEWLSRQEPQEITIDGTVLRTEADLIKYGELVFDAPIVYNGFGNAADVRSAEWCAQVGVPIAKDGTIPGIQYVIRQKGVLDVGHNSCGTCHTRVMPDGSTLKGAQGNFPMDRVMAHIGRKVGTTEGAREFEKIMFGAPWAELDSLFNTMSLEQIATMHEAIPSGVQARHGSSPMYPVQVPDLIGVRDRKYLDRTGLQLHRSIADMMRYAALNQGGDDLARYNDFIPRGVDFKTLPPAANQQRYSDEQLYALSTYIYSLQPPPNPHQPDALTKKGEGIFYQESCDRCHTPPLYTNNKLTPAPGFQVPEEHLKKYDILPKTVGTDPGLTMMTRRGTGYYKVPSLKGVWYRNAFEHSGSVASLEDWFDEKRVEEDYVPTSFKGYAVEKRAVKGHRYGLTLSPEDKKALIAFLRTI